MDWLPEAALAPDQLPEAVQEVGLPATDQLIVALPLYAIKGGDTEMVTAVAAMTV